LAGAAPVEIVERLDDVLAGLLLVGRRNGVFAIEEHVVGGAGDGLLDHRGVGAGHGEFGALQTGLTERIESVAHLRVFLLEALLDDCDLLLAWAFGEITYLRK